MDSEFLRELATTAFSIALLGIAATFLLIVVCFAACNLIWLVWKVVKVVWLPVLHSVLAVLLLDEASLNSMIDALGLPSAEANAFLHSLCPGIVRHHNFIWFVSQFVALLLIWALDKLFFLFFLAKTYPAVYFLVVIRLLFAEFGQLLPPILPAVICAISAVFMYLFECPLRDVLAILIGGLVLSAIIFEEKIYLEEHEPLLNTRQAHHHYYNNNNRVSRKREFKKLKLNLLPPGTLQWVSVDTAVSRNAPNYFDEGHDRARRFFSIDETKNATEKKRIISVSQNVVYCPLDSFL